MKIGLIGNGAIAQYVSSRLHARGHSLGALLLRPDRITPDATIEVGSPKDLPTDIDLVIDCAGHQALAMFGPDILARGTDMITVSLGALADAQVATALENAARLGASKLHLASGAIGALDCLSAARAGRLTSVIYLGRKPPQGWKGSPAEDKLDLDTLTDGAKTHFEGTARAAALSYPKNANVAAAVALAGLGFDDTQVRLIADAGIQQNIHEVHATGDFGEFRFHISGHSLPDNPRSSALAAMSVLAKLDQIARRITL
ncbi:MAG: aspartate dehydrogenase [Pseudomonadota bacterium]